MLCTLILMKMLSTSRSSSMRSKKIMEISVDFSTVEAVLRHGGMFQVSNKVQKPLFYDSV